MLHIKQISISDKQIITLLNNGYEIRFKLEDTYLHLPHDIYSSDVKLPDKYNSKESVYKYCYEDFGFNKYFTKNYVKNLVEPFVYISDGKIYARVGQTGIKVYPKRVIAKKLQGNKLYRM